MEICDKVDAYETEVNAGSFDPGQSDEGEGVAVAVGVLDFEALPQKGRDLLTLAEIPLVYEDRPLPRDWGPRLVQRGRIAAIIADVEEARLEATRLLSIQVCGSFEGDAKEFTR